MFNDDYILYHGSTVIVREPLTHVGRSDLDFGPGFYVTNDRQQAVDWANTKAARKKNPVKGIVNVYRFDQGKFESDALYQIKKFAKYNVDWLDFVAFSRKRQEPWKDFDWIEGGIANDHVIATVDAYIDGAMTAEKAMDALIDERLHHQVCISNQEIIDKYLTFVESIEV